MDTATINMQTHQDMMVSSSMTKKKASVFIHGTTDAGMKVGGIRENNTGLEHIQVAAQ